MKDPDLVLFSRALLLGVSLLAQRIAAWWGRLAITCEARYAQLTEATR
jgi:hypothetical protein